MDDFTTFIIAIVFVLIVALVLIGLYFVLRNGQRRSAARRPVAKRDGLAVAARLVRDKETGMLLVAMDGALYAKSSELTSAQRQRLADTARDLDKWLELPPKAPSPASTAAPAPALAVPLPAQPAVDAEAQLPVRPVSANPLESLRRVPTPAPAFRSITAQINDLLQGMLNGTPLEKAGISLTESPNVGVVVRIGLEEYPGIDAVPDEQVRTLIRAAVAEWEKQNK